ncbi:hypothetical protein J132_03586, partial [Termitomyces sp. J132]
VFFIKKKDGLL